MRRMLLSSHYAVQNTPPQVTLRSANPPPIKVLIANCKARRSGANKACKVMGTYIPSSVKSRTQKNARLAGVFDR